MRIDVRGVRILAQQPPAVDLTPADAAAGGAAAGGDSGTLAPTVSVRGLPTGVRGGGDSGSGKSEWAYSEESADAIYQPLPVEVQGIIYVYNPPPAQKPAEGAALGGGNPAAAPAGGPAPAGGVPPSGPAPAGGPGPAPATPATAPPAQPLTPVPAPAAPQAVPGRAPASPPGPPSPPVATPAPGGRP